MLTLNGLVLRERSLKDNDKFLDILTDTHGLIEVCAKGVKKPGSKNASVSQVFCYAKYCLSDTGGRYYLNSAEPIRTFFELSGDMEKFALASYFSEVLLYIATQEKPNNEVLRLILNCLHFLCLGNRPILLLKSIFELRLMSETGYTPNLIGCCECYAYTSDDMQFDMKNGRMFCGHCIGPRDLADYYPLDVNLLHYLRYIALTDMERLFSIKVRKEYLGNLNEITERYCELRLEKQFNTLNFFKELINGK